MILCSLWDSTQLIKRSGLLTRGAIVKAWSIRSTTTFSGSIAIKVWSLSKCLLIIVFTSEVMVAENNIVCTIFGHCARSRSTSSTNPISSIRSTSSSTKYLIKSGSINFLLIKSIARPGVHTATCIPSSISFFWKRILLPPYAASALIRANLPRLKNSSCVCWASSRVGTKIIAWIFFKSGSKTFNNGKVNAAVLPVPVWDCPTTSFPLAKANTVCSWIGVVFSYPNCVNPRRIESLSPNSENNIKNKCIN